jgi:hypothetical protein
LEGKYEKSLPFSMRLCYRRHQVMWWLMCPRLFQQYCWCFLVIFFFEFLKF